jgi:DNA-binding NarL/FixJ family response regulator
MSRSLAQPKSRVASVPDKETKRIFLIEDHTLVREGIKRMLTDEGDFLICGEADSARGVMALIAKANPDLVILDISLPGTDGLELIKDLKAQRGDLRMLALSMHDEELYAERVLRAGAHGYIMKQSTHQQLLLAVRTILRGEIYLSPTLSTRLLQSIVANKGHIRNELEKLSDRELEILRLIGNGFTTREVAKSLHISAKTVESHRGNMRQKLKLATGAELIRFAISHREQPV